MSNGLSLGSLNRARYAGLDFDTHNDDLRARLQVKYAADFNDFAISSLGIMLLDLTAYGLDTLSFYVDRRATDLYLSTARTRKSISRTSRQLGYKMGGAVASAVDLEVTVNNVYSFNVPIPARFQFNGPEGLIFEAAEEVVFTPAEQGLANSKIVPCYEGETIQESFVSDGTPAQVFELRRVPDDKFIVQGTVETKVDGADWEVVDLLAYGATDQFEVGFNDEPSTLRFGDGIAGNIPTAGASIDVIYVVSRGKAGQVAKETIQEETTKLVVSFTEIALTINNPEASVGGDDRETLESAKAFAPKVWKSRDVTVVGEDYEAHAGSYADPLFGRVAVARAISSRSAATDLTIQNYLTDIQTAVSNLDTVLASSISSINSSVTQIDNSVTAITDDLSDVTDQKDNIQTEANNALSVSRNIKDDTNEIIVDSTDINNHATNGKAAVDAIATAGTSQLTAADKLNIKSFFDLAIAEATSIGTTAGNAEASATIIVGNANAILTEVTDLTTSIASIASETSTISTQTSSISTQLANLDSSMTALEDAVNASEAGINEHFDQVLAADCKANVVTVPILVRDSGGFYKAPSTGLVDSLQTYLNTKKEVTQTVIVTSGENSLIPAVVRVRVGVLRDYSEAAVSTSVEAVVEGVLRDRAFGVSLYESDLDVILEVDGVSFINVRIQGHLDTDGVTVVTSRLDVDGNLIILNDEIISRGTITISTEAATT